MTRGFGGGAEVLVGVLGAVEEEAPEGGATFSRGGAAAQVGFEWGALVGRRGNETLDEIGVGEWGQSVPVKRRGESGRKAPSFSIDSIQPRMSGSCSPSQPR